MESKICRGPFHPPGGALVPISEFTVNKSGPREGKPLSRCKTCRSLAHSTTVPAYVFMPMLEKLVEHHTLTETAKITEIQIEYLKSLIKGKRRRIYKKTFLNISRAHAAIPKEKISIGPANNKSKRNGLEKLSYEERLNLRELVSTAQKQRFKADRKLLKHVV